MHKNPEAFTLVELLLVIGIIATLAVVTFVALNPAKRFADSRDARRQTDVETILSAVHQYIVDNKGGFPPPLSVGSEFMIGTATNGCSNNNNGCFSPSDSSCVDLTDALSRYLKTIPADPQNGSSANTQYNIVLDSNGIVTVKACSAEGGQISASR